MLSRRNWITEFIGHVLRRGISVDPDSAFDTASELHSELGDLNSQFGADSVLCLKALGQRQRAILPAASLSQRAQGSYARAEARRRGTA